MKKLKVEFKNTNKGITLISLVVTIVIMLILAGVTINGVINGGLLDSAKKAKEETEKAIIEEQKYLAQIEAIMNSENRDYIDVDGDKVVIPAGFAVSPLKEEQTISNGLVIIDSNGNEFVWIKVPKNAQIYVTAGTEITNFTTDEYSKIENDLHTYTAEYRSTMKCNDSYYSDEVTGLTKSDYNELKNKMLKSLYNNQGFWVARYEAGISEWRNSNVDISNDTNIVPSSNSNLYPFLYVTCSQAQTLSNRVCKKLQLTDYSSSLMFGIQWDLVLKFLESNGISKGELNENSSEWGNYFNSSFILDRGNYITFYPDKTFSKWYDYTENVENTVFNKEKLPLQTAETGILLTTGASNQNCKKNIYDLAGNVYEWTLEFSANINKPCVRRGGAATVSRDILAC